MRTRTLDEPENEEDGFERCFRDGLQGCGLPALNGPGRADDMRDFYRVGDVREVLQFDLDANFVFGQTDAGGMSAHLEAKRCDRLGTKMPVGDFGEAPNLLQQLVNLDVRSHNSMSWLRAALHVPVSRV